jgi:hypothetical protein
MGLAIGVLELLSDEISKYERTEGKKENITLKEQSYYRFRFGP